MTCIKKREHNIAKVPVVWQQSNIAIDESIAQEWCKKKDDFEKLPSKRTRLEGGSLVCQDGRGGDFIDKRSCYLSPQRREQEIANLLGR